MWYEWAAFVEERLAASLVLPVVTHLKRRPAALSPLAPAHLPWLMDRLGAVLLLCFFYS